MIKIKDETLKNNLLEMINKIPTMSNETLQYDLEWYSELMNQTNKDTELYQGYNLYINEIKKYLNGNTRVNDVKEEVKENKNDEVILDECGKVVWDVPMNTSFINCSKKDENYMDYKAYALFMYFSKRKGKEVCDMLNLDFSEIEEHRFLYDNFINENMEKFEKLSDWKKQNIKKQINKLTKAGNKVVSADYTSNGDLYYKFIPYVNKENKLIKDGTFVTIESDILKFLINSTNSNVIKIYCFLKWFLIDQKHYEKTKEVRYIEKPIDRKFILKQIGLNSNSGKMASSISRDIEDMLVMTHLIERRRIVKQEFGKTKYVYYYSIVPYEEWKSFRESVRKNGIKK